VCWCAVLLKIHAILFSCSYFYKEWLQIFVHILLWINCVMKEYGAFDSPNIYSTPCATCLIV
jgi:hypothetical protein